MKTYIGTKIVHMKPMTRQEYNDLRHWDLPKDEDGTDEGYLVEYTDGGKPNLQGYKGYVSWSPKKQADDAYRETAGISFGMAVEAMRKGYAVTRKGWNGKGMFVYIVPAAKYHAQTGIAKAHFGSDGLVPYNSYMAIKNVDETVSTWVPSVNDVLSDDWLIVLK